MKKSVIYFILIIFLVQNVFAEIDINLKKQEYQPRETLQAEITGNFVSLTNDNMFIFEEGIPRQVPVISDITRQNKKYYFYAVLPNKEGNYTIEIRNAIYSSLGELVSNFIVRNFTIKRTNESALSIDPGFIVAKEDFTINVKSLNRDSEVTLFLESTKETKKISLLEDEDKTLKFSIKDINQSVSNLKINNYNIPVFILNKISNKSNQDYEISFFPDEIKDTINNNKNYQFKLIVINTGEKNISEINLSSDINAIIKPLLIEDLDVDEKVYVNVTIPIISLSKDKLTGYIKARYNGKNTTIDIDLKINKTGFTPMINDSADNSTIPVPPIDKLSCSDFGKICKESEECNGESQASLEGPCCVGNCVEKKKPSSSYIIGIVLFIIALGILLFFLWKNKNKQKPKSSDEILKERENLYHDRMKNIPPKEVRDSLTNI
jgi:hypothetical protein